jgi:hypothetical protein
MIREPRGWLEANPGGDSALLRSHASPRQLNTRNVQPILTRSAAAVDRSIRMRIGFCFGRDWSPARVYDHNVASIPSCPRLS